jgi:hypothetical protein
MLNISGTLLSYIDRGLATPQSVNVTDLQDRSINLAQSQADNVEATSQAAQQVNISERARSALLTDTRIAEQQFLDRQLEASNERNAQQKVQLQDNLNLFIANSQRYSQLDTAAVAIENRQAINTYSLIENKVIATTNSNALES